MKNRPLTIRASLFLLAVLAVWIGFAARATVGDVAPATAEAAPNPHWAKDGCVNCHALTDGKPAPIQGADIDRLCLKCHDGTHALSEVHPIARAFDSSKFTNPGWPTAAGKIGCITCHDARLACDGKERPETNTVFLRGQSESPDVESKQFCSNCHLAQQSKKFNPHVMLTADGSAIEAKCQICHLQTPDRTILKRSGDAHLRMDTVLLCRSCHPHHKDISRKGHVGTKIEPTMLAFMRARELTGMLTVPDQHFIDDLVASNARPTLLVPDSQDRIICSTCHNPHEQGVFPIDSVMSYRAMRVTDGKAVSPVRGDQFCNHCHNGF